jgi:hypothetical protein
MGINQRKNLGTVVWWALPPCSRARFDENLKKKCVKMTHQCWSRASDRQVSASWCRWGRADPAYAGSLGRSGQPGSLHQKVKVIYSNFKIRSIEQLAIRLRVNLCYWLNFIVWQVWRYSRLPYGITLHIRRESKCTTEYLYDPVLRIQIFYPLSGSRIRIRAFFSSRILESEVPNYIYLFLAIYGFQEQVLG